MSLTVRELIAIPTLATTLLAGADGLDREVRWAHSCELPEPWHWMGPGDLLMTVGHGLPADEPGQVAFLNRIAEAGLSGVALAEGMYAPALADAARSAADRLAFPVLQTGYEIPFVSLARVVADSNQRESHQRLTRVLRAYDAFRLAISAQDGDAEFVRRIGAIAESPMCAVDVADRSVAMALGLELTEPVLAELLDRIGAQGDRLPAAMRVSTVGGRFVVQPLAGARWVLVTDVADHSPDPTVLEHVATIMLIQLERRRSADLARLHLGGRLLMNLVQGRADPGLAAAQLTDLGIEGPWRLLMVRAPDGELVAVQRRLLTAGVAHVLDRAGPRILALTSSGADPRALAEATGDPAAHVGASEVVGSLTRTPEAAREARWALETPPSGEIAHAAADSSLFLPRTVREGEAAVSRVLGPLLDYDTEHDTTLVESLAVFFAAQRSWQAAAKELCVHKQTLIYRMRRVEEITGRRLSNLEDVVELHLALRTRDLLRNK